MSANRRPDGGAGLARTLKAALVAALLAAGGIGYVRQTMDQDRLGLQVAQQETRLAELTEELRHQVALRSMLTSPEALRERVRLLKLNLATASPQQRLYLTLPPSSSTLAGRRTPPLDAAPAPATERSPAVPATLAQTGR